MARINFAMLLPLALFAVLALAFFIGLNRENKEELPTVFINKEAPPLPAEPLADFVGPTQAELKASGLKLVNFWASWCPPCRAEHPNLMRLRDEGWTIVGVNKSDEEANALGFLRELGNPYASIAADRSGRESIEWGVYGLPETFLIDAEGRIRFRHPGPVTERVWNDRFMPLIEALGADSE